MDDSPNYNWMTSNNTRTWLFSKESVFVQDRGLLFLEGKKSWNFDEIIPFLLSIDGVKEIPRIDDNDNSLVYEKEEGLVTVVIKKGGTTRNINFCTTITLQIPYEEPSFILMNKLIDKINEKFGIKIYSGILNDVVDLTELKSYTLKEAREKGHKYFYVKSYLHLVFENKTKEAEQFIEGKNMKAELNEIKEKILNKNYWKLGYREKYMKVHNRI